MKLSTHIVLAVVMAVSISGCTKSHKPDPLANALPLTASVCAEAKADELRLVVEMPYAAFSTTGKTPGDGSVTCEYEVVSISNDATDQRSLGEHLGSVRISILRSLRAPASYDDSERASKGAQRLPGVGSRAMVSSAKNSVEIIAIQDYTHIVAVAERPDRDLMSEPLGALVRRIFERVK